jgi:hypothetical protein
MTVNPSFGGSPSSRRARQDSEVSEMVRGRGIDIETMAASPMKPHPWPSALSQYPGRGFCPLQRQRLRRQHRNLRTATASQQWMDRTILFKVIIALVAAPIISVRRRR